MTEATLRRILLVGFMGSGKTSVGRDLARVLGWRFADFDEVVERRAGMSVADIFRSSGEARFREMEARVAEFLLAEDRIVLGSGGGWAAAPGRLESLPPGTETFWLVVGPEEALRRAAAEGAKRPLLAGDDPLSAARRLLAEREPFYSAARWAVDTERRSVEDVSTRILEILAEQHPVPRPE